MAEMPTCSPSFVSLASLPNVCSDTANRDLAAYFTTIPAGNPGWLVRNYFGFYKSAKGYATIPDWGCAVFGKKPGWIAQGFLFLPFVLASFVDKVVANWNLGCRLPNVNSLVAQLSAIGFLERWMGAHLTQQRRPLEAATRFACPDVTPSTSDVIDAVVYRGMDSDDGMLWCRMHGWCNSTFQLAVQAHTWHTDIGHETRRYTHGTQTFAQFQDNLLFCGVTDPARRFQIANLAAMPSPHLSVSAWRHNVIADADIDAQLKLAGVPNQNDRQYMLLERYWHSPQLIVDMYRRGCLDSGMDVKARLREVGVTGTREQTELIACTYTRWSLGEIYRALHILRAGRVSADLVYSVAQARKDIAALGYDPERIDQMIYMSKTDVSHRQLLRPYLAGVIDDLQLTDYLLDDGYNTTDTNNLLLMYRIEQKKHQWSESGGPSIAQLVKDAAAGAENHRDFMDDANEMGASQLDISKAQTQVVREQARSMRRAVVGYIKTGLKAGEIAVDSAIGQLVSAGIDTFVAGQIVSLWLAEWDVVSKQLSAAQLCDFANKGLIPPNEYANRLRGLGYAANTIALIMQDCEDKYAARQTAAQAKAATARAATAAKAAAQQARAAVAAAKTEAARQRTAATLERKAGRPASIGVAAVRTPEETAALKQAQGWLLNARGILSAVAKATADVERREKEIFAGKLAEGPGPDPDSLTD